VWEKSSMSTWTPFTLPLSSEILSCAAGQWSSLGEAIGPWSAPLRTRPGASACVRQCQQYERNAWVPRRSSCLRIHHREAEARKEHAVWCGLDLRSRNDTFYPPFPRRCTSSKPIGVHRIEHVERALQQRQTFTLFLSLKQRWLRYVAQCQAFKGRRLRLVFPATPTCDVNH